MSAEATYAAVDLGAESGRVVTGAFDGERVRLDEVHRFANRPVRLPDGLHWDLLGLYREALAGLDAIEAPLDGVGVDSWGVDYALLDEAGRMLGLPYHYRDERSVAMVDVAFGRVPREDLYAATGIQTMPINTVFQLLAEGRAADTAQRIAFVPDLFALWLSGVLANESTIASTSGLLDARSGGWAQEVIARLGLPAAPFRHPTVEPGTTLDRAIASECRGVPVHAVAGHDTAAAFAAAPLRAASSGAILSSGTWSLLGVEVPAPVLDERAAGFNLTNERGVCATTRLLRNVMGLWLVQECRREWDADYDELHRLAADADPDVALFDPDDDALLAPGDMPRRVRAAIGPDAPEERGALVRSILVSLACKYRLVLERLEAVTGRRVDTIHVIGGGVRNTLLCRLTADVTQRTVIAGPAEATALGNVLCQALATGRVGSLDEMHAIAAASVQTETYLPGDAGDAYDRFRALTQIGAR